MKIRHRILSLMIIKAHIHKTTIKVRVLDPKGDKQMNQRRLIKMAVMLITKITLIIEVEPIVKIKMLVKAHLARTNQECKINQNKMNLRHLPKPGYHS